MRSVGVGHPLAHSYLMKRQRDRAWPDGGPEILAANRHRLPQDR